MQNWCEGPGFITRIMGTIFTRVCKCVVNCETYHDLRSEGWTQQAIKLMINDDQ